MNRVTLTIDGRNVEVEAGTTVLAAARALGIDIPTLCDVAGYEPVASCFVCAVQIEGRRTLSPACAMPVAPGMIVRTNTDDVIAARRMALELLLSDHAGECIAPCAAKCPARLDIPAFVRSIAETGISTMAIITETLALPGSLGRICPRLCEEHCRRCEQDQELAIGALHRYAADRDRQAARPFHPPRSLPTGKNVAIVGAGPAGLAAAWFLQQKGHHCTLCDAAESPGGMLRYGIPSYRLPKDALDAEIEGIRALGARFRMGQRWGRDFSLADLRRDHHAVFIAVGAQRAQSLRCEGDELALAGTELLALVAAGNPPSLGQEVVVIGGGNTAMDCARSALRLDARKVTVLYRRTRREMPCLLDEVEAAEIEGVDVHLLVAPVRIERTAAHRLLLTCQRMTLGDPDASGRRQPVPVAGSEFALECSTVIAATGQSVEREIAERDGLQVTGWGIAADDTTLATNIPGVFAGGDAVLGPDLAVRAVAAGRMAAVSIDQYLRGEPVTGEPATWNIALRPMDDAERAEIFRGIEGARRPHAEELTRERRAHSFDEVEPGLTDEEARREARRCLSCGCRKADCCSVRSLAAAHGANPYEFAGARRRFSQDLSHPEIVYEPGKCIMCDACVRVAADAGEPIGLSIVGRGFDVTIGVPFGEPLSEALRTSALRCVQVCPSGALAVRSLRACDCGFAR
ncbi:MAG TPA: FAD-dependent oxidoreductase [Vicinamibacterales bacterium]